MSSQAGKSAAPGRLTVAFPANVRGWLVLALAPLFGLALPLFLIAGNVQSITNSDWLYSYNWWRNDIPYRTNLTASELSRGADQIKDYFSNGDELLDLRVVQSGREVSLYKEREVLHMVDVKDLMRGVFNVATYSGLVALAIALAGLSYFRREFWSLLLRTLKWSAAVSGTAVGIFAIAIVIDFDFVFRQFHFLSFANDLWLLNPYTDYLIIMFPQRFFFEAAVFIAVFYVAQFALLYLAVWLTHRRMGRAGEAAPG